MNRPVVRAEAWRKHRCPCGALLGIQHQGALHVKYKQFVATVRGLVDVSCPRCGCLSTLSSSSQ